MTSKGKRPDYEATPYTGDVMPCGDERKQKAQETVTCQLPKGHSRDQRHKALITVWGGQEWIVYWEHKEDI